MTDLALEAIFRRDTAVIAVALLALTVLAWLALLAGAGTGMDPFAMSGWLLPSGGPAAQSWTWTPAYWLIAFLMWAVMMVAMMLPSASPTVLLYGRVVRQAERKGKIANASACITAFAAGYLTLWSLFSAVAVVLQWALEQSGAMSAMMMLRAPWAAGALLVAAGLYQLTPLKENCLAHCRSPAAFLAAHWRPGALGAWRMGLAHGIFCVGCCAALMLLLFVGGVMNLVWIAGLSILVLAEKLMPRGERLRVPLGVLLMIAGAGLIASAAVA
jgi:predicted metal-binding membrane protein